MKKFIKSLLLFSGFAILFYCFAILVAGKTFPKFLKRKILTENKISTNDLSDKRFEDADRSKPVDIMVVGSSHAYRGYDTRIFQKAGFTSYNLGSSAQTLNLTNFIYSNYVNKLNPKTLIIDIYPLMLTIDGQEGELNLMPLFYQNFSFVKNTFKSFNIRILNSLIYFYAFGNPNVLKNKKLESKNYIDGGYISSFKTLKNSKNYESKVLKVEEDNITALKSIINDAKKRGIKVFLFQSPLPEARYKSFINNKEIDSIMSSIGNYCNYNEVRFLPKQYFIDDDHINQKGVDVYNKWVIEKLREKE